MNNWILTGRLGADAEKRETQSGTIVTFDIAVDIPQKSGDVKKTLWVRAVWFKPNDGLMPYLKKGVKVLLNGRPQASCYLDNSKQAVAVQEIVVNQVEMCDFPKDTDLPFSAKK